MGTAINTHVRGWNGDMPKTKINSTNLKNNNFLRFIKYE